MRWVVLALALSSTGCGVAIQTAMGWTSVESRERTETRDVTVNTVPPSSTICREGTDGRCRDIGRAPHTDSVDVRVAAEVRTPSSLGLWLGSGLEILTAIVAITTAPSRCSDGSGDCPAGVFLTAAAGIFFGVVDMFAAVLYPAMTGTIDLSTELVTNPVVKYRARKEGYTPRENTVVVGRADELVLRLDPIDDVANVALVEAARTKMIVAVMPVSASNELSWLDDLGRRLRIDLTGAGLQTVEQVAQAKAIAASMCTGEDCHVDVGRSLAASHVLVSRVTKLGQRCVLAAELVDLAREVTVSAVGARADCDDATVVDKLSRDVARDLLIGFRTGTSAP